MYKLISIIGMIIRSYLLTNAFEYYFGNVLIAEIINCTIGEFILWKTTYHISVGSIYQKNSDPTVGSLLYTVFYVINNVIMMMLCVVGENIRINLYWILILYLAITIFNAILIRKVVYTNKYNTI